MKAILILDEMPKSCTDCPYLGFEKDTEKPACVICEGRFKKDEDIENERSVICPLRPIPTDACKVLIKGLDAWEGMRSVEVSYVRRAE